MAQDGVVTPPAAANGVAHPVLTRIEGAIGRITLNRPRVINAIDAGMVSTIGDALERWRDDDRVAAVLLDGAGDRGLCSGGDLRALSIATRRPDGSVDPVARDRAHTFWSREYQLCALISHYPKPYIAFMDGITMGGGLGLSAHGSHRIATERSRMAMPEVAIGYAPDVGVSWRLAHAPGATGRWAAVTGSHFGPADGIDLGLANYLVASDTLPLVAEALVEGVRAPRDVDVTLRPFLAGPGSEASRRFGPGFLEANRAWIDRAFAGAEAVDVLAALRAEDAPAARATAEALARRSPTGVAAALLAIQRNESASGLEASLNQDYWMSMAFLDIPDFAEGIRATLIDKDHDPHWSPARLEDVDPRRIAAIFEPRGAAPVPEPARE